MVGDDEVITSNSLIYTILCVLIGPIVPEIRVSWEDVQFNQHIFNYAEGWVFLPPSMDSGFESVNKYNRGNGVPFVLDAVKFKDLSCVRKQSAMEQDLPSKFKSLAAKAAWTNPSWCTWNSHQWAMVLGIEIFDFMRSSIFPYLFPSEGGCGGAPPWGNMFTVGACIHRFRKGKAKTGIIGIMSDSNRLQRGEIRPEDAFFTKNLNLAITGDRRWTTIRSQLEKNKHQNVLEGLEYDQELVAVADEAIPQELVDKSATLHPEDVMTGAAIAHLRDMGYIITELDLVMRVENEKRLSALWGRIPMQEVEDQIAVRKQEYQESFHQVLTEISQRQIGLSTRKAVEQIDDPMEASTLSVMEEYYRVRVEQITRLTSFIYNERVRIFKHEDVEAYFNRGMQGIRDRFCVSLKSQYRPELRRMIQLPAEARTLDTIEEWLSSNTLKELLIRPIPPGVGPDDSRIVRDADAELKLHPEKDGYILLIISSDKRLCNATQTLLSHNYPDKIIRVVGCNIPSYLTWSITPAKFEVRRFLQPGKDPSWLRKKKIWNPVTRKEVPLHGALLAALEGEAKHLWRCRAPALLISYDFPNLNRGMKRFMIRENGTVTTLDEYTGGYLSKGYLRADLKFPIRPIEEVQRLPEFDAAKIRSHYPIDRLRDGKLRLFLCRKQKDAFYHL
jgi:hypothetical protein